MPDTAQLRQALPKQARDWLDRALRRLDAQPQALTELFPQLARKLGRDLLGGGKIIEGTAVVDLGAWRLCDAGGFALLQRADPQGELIVDLFLHGDLEERTIALRSAARLPISTATLQLLEEVQRTNTVRHFEAAICETNLAVRALEHPHFDETAFNRLILKLAFLDLPLDRVFEAEQKANPTLSRMLHALATERQAAGRSVWADTDHLIALAPMVVDPESP